METQSHRSSHWSIISLLDMGAATDVDAEMRDVQWQTVSGSGNGNRAWNCNRIRDALVKRNDCKLPNGILLRCTLDFPTKQ